MAQTRQGSNDEVDQWEVGYAAGEEAARRMARPAIEAEVAEARAARSYETWSLGWAAAMRAALR